MGLSRVIARAGHLDLVSQTWCRACRHVCAVCARSLLFPPRGPLAQTLRGDVEQRNNEDPEERCGEHAAEYRRADRLARDRAGAAGDDQREETEDEGEAR